MMITVFYFKGNINNGFFVCVCVVLFFFFLVVRRFIYPCEGCKQISSHQLSGYWHVTPATRCWRGEWVFIWQLAAFRMSLALYFSLTLFLQLSRNIKKSKKKKKNDRRFFLCVFSTFLSFSTLTDK